MVLATALGVGVQRALTLLESISHHLAITFNMATPSFWAFFPVLAPVRLRSSSFLSICPDAPQVLIPLV